MSTKEIQARHDRDVKSHTRLSQMHKDRGELLDALKRANDMINDSYQCECENPKTPCPCLEDFLDNIQAILDKV